MIDETYENYIRSILGYPETNYNNYLNYEQNNYNVSNKSELEKYYPEIYKIIHPMIAKKCNQTRGNVTNDDIENMTDEIYNAIEQDNEIQININLGNEVQTTQTKRNTKPNVKVQQVEDAQKETRSSRQINRGLRDLIKILLIRELINKTNFPNRPPLPPHPPVPGPRPTFGPGGRPPFNRDDIFEY